MAVSKAYLRKLGRVVKDRKILAAIRKFLVKHDEEINVNKLMITSNGDMFYEGSIGNYTFYKKWGKYHQKKKSSLTTKRFQKDKAFKGSRESAERFALGNQLASKLYKMVDLEKKSYKLFCFLKTRAIGLIKEGKNVDEAKIVLLDYLRSFAMLKEERRTESKEGKTKEGPGAACKVRKLNDDQHQENKIGTSNSGITLTGNLIGSKFLRGTVKTVGLHHRVRTGWALVRD